MVIGIGTCVALLFGGVSSCSMMAGSGVGGVFTSSYLSEDADMLAAEAAYCELEKELQYELDHYEALHPGYDEYRFDLDEIEHAPYVLISILTAFHEGVFTINEVQEELQMLFEKQYILTQTVEVEVRYRTETRTDSEGNDYDVEVPYNYYICKVKLENFDLSHVPVYIMDEETLSHIFEKHKVNYHSNGVGVYNVQKRLKLYYGEEYGIVYKSRKNEGTRAVITIPMETGGKL